MKIVADTAASANPASFFDRTMNPTLPGAS